MLRLSAHFASVCPVLPGFSQHRIGLFLRISSSGIGARASEKSLRRCLHTWVIARACVWRRTVSCSRFRLPRTDIQGFKPTGGAWSGAVFTPFARLATLLGFSLSRASRLPSCRRFRCWLPPHAWRDRWGAYLHLKVSIDRIRSR